MTAKPKTSQKPNGAIILTIALIVIFVFIFLIAFIISSTVGSSTPVIVNENTYLQEVTSALEGADPSIGEQLIEEHTCNVCHVLGNGTVAPLFAGIASRAEERHPPLSAEQYLYESIMFPGALVVDEYSNSMPNNYGDLLTEPQIGQIITYLMTLTAEPE